MKAKHGFWTGVATTAIALMGLSVGLPALAIPAILVGDDPDSEINVRAEPYSDAEELYYGFVGDEVEILDDAIGDDGYAWYYVQFLGSGAEGWVRGDYVSEEMSEEMPEEVSEGTYEDSSAYETSESFE